MPYSNLIQALVVSGNTTPTAILVGSTFLLLILLFAVVIWRYAGKNEALKYEFITIIAHKFRTPMTHVKWLTEALLTNEQDSFKRASLEDMQQSNQKLIDLTGTLIELTDSDRSSKAEYSFERTSLCQMVRGVGESFKTSFHEKNIFFAVQCPPTAGADEIMVKVDRARMEFVLAILFENACLYTSPGKNVDVIVSRSGNKATISVIDHGIGIDPADMPNIFTKFFRAQNAIVYDTEGFGVGLYMAKTIVRRHGGKIEARSGGQNAGTTFTVTLPISKK